MTSRGDGTRVRKAPAERRNEIVAAAARVGLTEGLECITLRQVAGELGVRPGLVGHYFPVAEELVAEAFTSATMAELDALLPTLTEQGDGIALRTLGDFLAYMSGPEFDNVSKLWLNARHLSRYSPPLHVQVVSQELLWCRRVEQLIVAGVREGSFRCDDPWAAAVRVMVAVDGTSAYVNTSIRQRAEPIAEMVRAITEAELGLPSGALRSD
ncbi:TetR family transcriptional regulator [Streptomyces brevispora]|uniref:TetR/AcrR family transcriptional regulator n=1 Tax=Streptomyces brevispora TaxID=887462 RepID=UPI002E3591EF|nr:TetR family transcriptional regulator [Streptomyces brevispora]